MGRIAVVIRSRRRSRRPILPAMLSKTSCPPRERQAPAWPIKGTRTVGRGGTESSGQHHWGRACAAARRARPRPQQAKRAVLVLVLRDPRTRTRTRTREGARAPIVRRYRRPLSSPERPPQAFHFSVSAFSPNAARPPHSRPFASIRGRSSPAWRSVGRWPWVVRGWNDKPRRWSGLKALPTAHCQLPTAHCPLHHFTQTGRRELGHVLPGASHFCRRIYRIDGAWGRCSSRQS